VDIEAMRGFENRLLTRIFGPKRDEVTGSRRKLHNKELHVACSTNWGMNECIENIGRKARNKITGKAKT
jgi:hypothetical protein